MKSPVLIFKQKQTMADLIKFIKLAPQNILSECVGNVDKFGNREERRNYDKLKTLDEKIEFLLKNRYDAQSLIENLCSTYPDTEVNDNDTYDEILLTINANNCIPKVLYILRQYFNGDFKGNSFSEFIRSEPFQKTIKDEWEEPQPEISTVSDNDFEGENKMIYYIGSIQHKGTFYNFRPYYIYDDISKSIEEYPFDIAKENFPKTGIVNLRYGARGDDAYKFLESLNYDKVEMGENEADTKRYASIYAIHFDEHELSNTTSDITQKKLDLRELSVAGVKLSERIKPITDLGIYKIVTAKGTETINNESFNGMIWINEKEYFAGEEVLLSHDEKLFGPYTLQERSIDGEKYLRPDSGANGYVLKYYEKSDYEEYSLAKYSHILLRHLYTNIAFIRGVPHDFDTISDSILLTKLTDSISIESLYNNTEEFLRLYRTSPFLRNIPAEILNERSKRVQKILSGIDEFEGTIKEIRNSLIGNDKFINQIPKEKIEGNDQYKQLRERVNDLKAEKEDLIKRSEDLNKQIELLENRPITEPSSNDDSEKEELKNKVQELEDKLSLIENYNQLLDMKKKLDEDYKEAQTLYDAKVVDVNNKKKELEKIQGNIQDYITNELSKPDVTKMLKSAFDPYISNAMIEAAGKYQDDTEANRYRDISKSMQEFSCSEMEKEILIDKLVEGVKKVRNYTKNEILNMYICLSQNFLTVFSGEPGTGKTSMCNILAESLGLNKFGSYKNISKDRYVPVSVERGWSSKRDLIGYYNPLTKKYDRSNAKIYDGLMILNEEKQNSRFPYIILLDEANLSPIEYYWADFMRITDGSDNNTYINIGLDKDIYIPKTLHFLATINNDQTTEQLSPRLIDRAWIIKLPKRDIIESPYNIDEYFKDSVLWSDIEKAFVISEVKEMPLKDVAERIYSLFDKHHLTVSPRVQQSIKKYVCVAREIMENESESDKKEKALDFAITQKLLPKINGYYDNYKLLFDSLKRICDENHLFMTKEALNSMEEFRAQNMGYCQYLG